MQKFSSYEDLDKSLGFSDKAGFQLSPLQHADAETFATWKGYLNRYEVGGGKTVVATVVSLLKGVEVTVVTVPPILLRPWKRWLDKVSSGAMLYVGKPAERVAMQALMPAARWIVCSHAIFLRDYDVIVSATADRNYEVIVDEAHALKNIASQLYKRTASLAYGYDLGLLTATPTNKPTDAYAYIKLKTPTVYRGHTQFMDIHTTGKDFFKKVKGYKNLDLLAKNFALQSIERTKFELHGYKNDPDYPDCSYDLDPEHQKLYEKLVDEQLLLLPDGMKIDATTSQRLYHAMQQVVVNWDHFSGIPGKRSAAYDMIDLTIEQTECNQKGKSKLIIWTNYKLTSRSIWKYIESLGISVVAAYSETKAQDSFDKFMDDDNCRVLVAQPGSAGAGLNPQAVCWESLTLEANTVTIQTIQSLGRLDRVGQLHTPTMRVACAMNTIQVGLREQLFNNADLVARVEGLGGSKKSLREVLMGR